MTVASNRSLNSNQYLNLPEKVGTSAVGALRVAGLIAAAVGASAGAGKVNSSVPVGSSAADFA